MKESTRFGLYQWITLVWCPSTMYPSSDGYLQQDNAPHQITSNQFHEKLEFTVLHSPDFNPTEHLWEVTEIMDMQLTNLQQLCYHDNMDQNLWNASSTLLNFAMKNYGSYEGKSGSNPVVGRSNK